MIENKILKPLKSNVLYPIKYNIQYRAALDRLSSLRNKHSGKKGVILCNGPSLLKTDFELLNNSDAIVFGLNKINLLQDQQEVRTDYLSVCNSHVIEQNKDFYNMTEMPVFIDEKGMRGIVGTKANIFPLRALPYHGFSHNLTTGYWQGYTVTYMTMQVAFYLGITELTLVGCDHSFVEKGKANKSVQTKGGDNSHFIKGYFKEGETWQLPDLPMSEVSYLRAKVEYENEGRKIFDSTVDGKLSIFDKLPLDKFCTNK